MSGVEDKVRSTNLSRSVGPQFASPLRYPGGKGRMGPWLAEVLKANGLTGGWYVEPYAGGAGAALYLLLQGHVSHIVINDADPVIHAFWQSVVNNAAAFENLVWSTPVTLETRHRMVETIESPTGRSELELGFAAFFLNRTNRSGILRGGVIGGKEQAGQYKLDARYKREDLVARVRAIASHREKITVTGMDALDMLISCSPGLPKKTLVYLDPPYYVKGSQLYRNHYQHGDHEAISHFASQVKYPLLITYDDCPEIRKLYRNMQSTKFSLVYSTHLDRPTAREVLIHANLKIPRRPTMTRDGTMIKTDHRRVAGAASHA